MVQHEETAEQAAAFAYYYSLGEERTIKKLLLDYPSFAPERKKLPSYDTLKKWSVRFHWQERIAIKDKAVAAGVDKQTTKAAIDRRAKWLSQTEKRLDTAFDEHGNPKFAIEDNATLNATVKLALSLLGEPEKQEVEHRGEIKIIRVKNTEDEN